MDRFATKTLDFVYGLCLNHPKKVMSFWIIGALAGVYWAQDLTNYCIFSYLPPDGSPSGDAYNKVSEYFPQFLFQDYEIIIIQTKDEYNVINNESKSLLLNINDSLWHNINTDYNILLRFATYFDAKIALDSPIYPLYKQRFISADNNTMISFLSLDINHVEQEVINGFINELRTKLSSLTTSEDITLLSLTGPLSMWNQGMLEMENDMTTKDVLLMPFIFILMMYMVGSWKFICIVGPVLGMSIIISMSTFVPFGKFNVFEINPLVPSIMLFLSMALSVDYSMFLISRFTSEISKGSTVQHAVREMIKYSAHVVVLSGLVLMVSYLGVTFFPVAGMDTVGYAAIVTIIYTVLINITFTSSTILAFPNFFGNLELLPNCCIQLFMKCKCKCSQQNNDNNDQLQIQIIESDEVVKPIQIQGIIEPMEIENIRNNLRDLHEHEKAQNWYFKLTQYTTKSPWKYIVPVLVYTAMSPAIYVLFSQYEYSMNFADFFPSDSTSVKAYQQMIGSFPPSFLMPYYLLGVTNNAQNADEQIWSKEFFDTFCYVTNQIMNEYSISAMHFHSVLYAPNVSYNATSKKANISEDEIFCFDSDFEYKNMTYSMVDTIKLLYNHKQFEQFINPAANSKLSYHNKDISAYHAYVDAFMDSMISDTQTASIMSFVPPFNPLVESAVKPSREMRQLIDDINNNETIRQTTKFYIHNSLYWQIDSMDETDERMPWMLTIIIIGIFFLIGLMFKAPFLPFRLFFVVIIPIAFVYGVAVGIYVLGWFDWLGWSSLHNTNGIVWMLPCISLTILMGLAMDYEIFLFSRVFEYRKKGYTTRASIILAVANTGPIISSAGTVMAMAFCGMLLQNIVSSNQMGFLFVFGVLIDTFVIRPLLVPSLLSLVDFLNWYPNKMPKENLLNEYGALEE